MFRHSFLHEDRDPTVSQSAAPCETGHELCPQVDTPEMGRGVLGVTGHCMDTGLSLPLPARDQLGQPSPASQGPHCSEGFRHWRLGSGAP